MARWLSRLLRAAIVAVGGAVGFAAGTLVVTFAILACMTPKDGPGQREAPVSAYGFGLIIGGTMGFQLAARLTARLLPPAGSRRRLGDVLHLEDHEER